MLQKKLLICYLCFIATSIANAQETLGKNEIGVNIGGLFYQGDLSADLVGSYKTARPVVGIFYNRIFTPYLSARANFVIGSLAGDDAKNESPAYMRRRNFNFHSPVAELSGMIVFNAFGNNANTEINKLSPYAFAGVGVSFLDIHRDWSRIDTTLLHGGSTLAGLIKDNSTAMPRAIPVIPVGVGLKYAILPRISLAVEGSYRFLFTDYLDGFSYAANPEKRDSYYSVTIGAVYNFGGDGSGNGNGSGKWRKPGKSKTDCPKVF